MLFPSSFPVPERPGLSTKFDYSISASFGLSWFPFLKVHSHLFEWDELHLESRFFYPTALSPSTRVRGERKSKHGRAAYAWLTDDHSPKLNMQPFLLLLSHTELLVFNILCKTNEEVRCFFKMPSDFKNYDGSLVVTLQEQHSYNTRNKANLKIPSVKRNWGKQRTGYHAVSDFNSLDKTIRASDNVNILKRQIFNSLI